MRYGFTVRRIRIPGYISGHEVVLIKTTFYDLSNTRHDCKVRQAQLMHFFFS